MSNKKKNNSPSIKNNHIWYICLCGIFSALVFIVTAYLHIPIHNGYIHFGDGFIFLAACLLPMPYSLCVGATGAALADVLTGFAIWAPGSMIIKAFSALLFTCKGSKIITVRNCLILIPAAVISTTGYYLYEALITGNFISPLASIPGSIIQAIASSSVFIVAGLTMDRLGIKKKFMEVYR